MNRRWALASIAVVIVLCLVGVSVAAVAAGGSALAYKVNGSEGSQSTVDGQLDDLAHSDATKQASTTQGSIDSRAAAQVVTLNIINEILAAEAARKGVKVTDAQRDQARTSLGASLDGYPDSYRDLAVELQATALALGFTDSDALNAFLVKQFRRADIYVNPRYGRWSPRFGVCPPTGCASIANQSSGG
jgi:hypothetical protein